MKSIYSRPVLQNASICEYKKPTLPTIKLTQGDPDWEIAYANWLAGKNPTDSPEWKAGVYLHFEPIEKVEEEPPAPTPFITFKRIAYCVLVLIIFLILILSASLFNFP